MDKVYDVIIVGGGINGCSTAFHLAKRGFKVAILEMNRLASKSSGAAAGILGAQTELTEDGPLFQFAKKSRAMFPEVIKELEETSGVHIGYMNKGMYKVATTVEQVDDFKRIAQFQIQSGEQAEWLSIEELKEREPAVSEKLFGALYLKNDGQVQAYELSLAFARAAIVHHTEVYEYTNVYEWILKDSKIHGVRTNQGDFYAETVVVTTGAWNRVLLEKTGLELPIVPVKGECVSVITQRPLIDGTIFSHDCYIVPKKAGRLLIGATVKANTFNEKVTFEGVFQLLEKAKCLIPEIAQAEWEHAWAGIRPLSEDGLPFLGEHPDYQNLYIATGHFRNGILLAPATGEFMADLIEGKEIPFSEMKVFGLQRLRRSIQIVGGL
jgi:glycine oxidase